jgi:hypothetical protein
MQGHLVFIVIMLMPLLLVAVAFVGCLLLDVCQQALAKLGNGRPGAGARTVRPEHGSVE